MRAFEQLDGVAEEAPKPIRPPRPGAIEFAAALLIVAGVLGMLGLIAGVSFTPAALEAFAVLTFILNVTQIVVGVLIRWGRIWIVAVNYVAVLAFVDLLAAGLSPLSLMLGLAEVVVVVILLLNKPWFDALARWRSSQPLTPPTARPPTR